MWMFLLLDFRDVNTRRFFLMLKCLMLMHLHIGVAQVGLRGLKLPPPPTPIL